MNSTMRSDTTLTPPADNSFTNSASASDTARLEMRDVFKVSLTVLE